MQYFKYRRNQLYCENVNLKNLALRYKTPLYVYSNRFINDRFVQIKKAFSAVNPLICYSVKANSNSSILKLLVNKGSGLDIVSGGELYRAKKIGCSPKKIVYASVGKTEQEIKDAIKYGILMFNVESLPELEKINKIAGKLKKKTKISLRINPDITPGTHHYITTGKKETKFGIDIEKAKKIFLNKSSYSNVDICGVHIHIGSQITKVSPFVKAIKKIITMLNILKKKGVFLEYFNIGGGFGIKYDNEEERSAGYFARQIVPLLKKTGLKVILEPGRFIIGNSGVLLTQVLYVKENPDKGFIIVDGAMNDFIRPSLYNATHRIIPIAQSAKRKAQSGKSFDVVGPVCESGDFFGKNRNFKVSEKQYIAVMGAGAYGQSMASNYNSRVKPAEVLVKNNKSFLIRKRETYKDLISKEIII